MTMQVQLKNTETGAVTTHFSVDAKDILARGEHVQVGGVPVAFQPQPKVREPGPATVETVPGEPTLKSAGFGKWNVLKADGSKANDKPLSKPDAEALLAALPKE